MFVLTRRMVILEIVALLIYPPVFYVLFATPVGEQPLWMFTIMGAFVLVFSGLREYLIRGEDKRHHRASLNFSYTVSAMAASLPVLIILFATVLKDASFNLWTLLLVFAVTLYMAYARAKRTLKDFSPKKIFEIETSPRWSERAPFNSPYLSLAVYTVIAGMLFIVTGIQLADMVTVGFNGVDLILVVLTSLVLLAGSYPFMAHQSARNLPVLPYLYSLVNVVLLVFGQAIWFQGTPLADINHWATLIYLWLVILSLGVPHMFHKRSYWADNYS